MIRMLSMIRRKILVSASIEKYSNIGLRTNTDKLPVIENTIRITTSCRFELISQRFLSFSNIYKDYLELFQIKQI
jgi:hypothetical protein